MKFYSALIRLAGSPLNEVWKHDLAAPEVIFLANIHNKGAMFPIKELKETGSKVFEARDHRRLRAQMRTAYGHRQDHVSLMESLFGSQVMPLPEETSIADLTDEPELEDVADEDETEDAKAKIAETPPDQKKAEADAEAEAVELVRQSIKDLGGTIPRGPSGRNLENLRKQLRNLQAKALEEAEKLAETAGQPDDELTEMMG